MMNETKYQYATLEEYGYKDYKVLKLIWKILKVLY